MPHDRVCQITQRKVSESDQRQIQPGLGRSREIGRTRRKDKMREYATSVCRVLSVVFYAFLKHST